MSSPGVTAVPASARLVGVDLARAVALLGMMSVHVLPELDAAEAVTPAYLIFAGRAAALFALLAGTGLALMTGGARPRLRPARAVAASVLTRAAVVALVGLLLGQLSPPVAVILTNYGLLFALALPALWLRVRTLAVLATVWVVGAPLVSHLARSSLPPGPGEQPSLSLLAHPVVLARALTLTGYYPALQWIAYLLVGVAVGRLALGRARTAAWLLGGGVTLAVLARLTSDVLLRQGLAALRAAGPADLVPGGPTGEAVGRLQLQGRFGVPPTTTWWWQAVASPHTATPFDLAHTIGCALAVLGLALLLAPAAGPRLPRAVVAALAAAGSTTLTLYTVHVLALTARVGPADRRLLLAVHVLLAVVLATAWRRWHRRGPLEHLVARATPATRHLRH